MITTLWYAIWIIQDIMQGFITVNWQVFYREKDKMAGVKNKPWQWNTGIHFSFFSSGIIVVETYSTIIHHVNRRPDAEHKLPSRMFCSEGFYLVGTLSATFLLLYQLHEFMFYIFRTLMWNILVFFFNSQHPPIKKSNTRPPKNSFCLIYHSLLTSCVVLIDLIYTH